MHAINAFVRSLSQLESTLAIKVTAVAPEIVRTPIWTSEKLAMIKAEDQWILPEDVAAVMIASVEKTEISSRFGEKFQQGEQIKLGSGSIIEVSKGRLRDAQPLNDPGPSGAEGTTATGFPQLIDEVHDLLSVDGWGKPS